MYIPQHDQMEEALAAASAGATRRVIVVADASALVAELFAARRELLAYLDLYAVVAEEQ